jgi:hypothetical protein
LASVDIELAEYITMPVKRQQRTVGAIVKIPLDDAWHTYAQILPEADCAVFDARTKDELTVSEVFDRPVLFRLAVYRHAFTLGGWPKVGKAPLRDEFASPVPKFMQDALQPTSFSILTLPLFSALHRLPTMRTS